jgi:hypothetical protein
MRANDFAWAGKPFVAAWIARTGIGMPLQMHPLRIAQDMREDALQFRFQAPWICATRFLWGLINIPSDRQNETFREIKMKRMALFAIIAFAVPLSNAEAKNLSGEQISALISGKTAYWHNVRGHKTGTITWSANGSQLIKGDLGVNIKKDTGKWRVSGDKLCST